MLYILLAEKESKCRQGIKRDILLRVGGNTNFIISTKTSMEKLHKLKSKHLHDLSVAPHWGIHPKDLRSGHLLLHIHKGKIHKSKKYGNNLSVYQQIYGQIKFVHELEFSRETEIM